MAYYEGELGGFGGGYNNGFGNGWEGIIGLALVASLFGGGWGFGGNRNGNAATQADVSAGFASSATLNSLNEIKLAQGSNLNFINQGFSGLNTNILTSANNIQREMAECCCGTQRMIEKSTCEILQANNANTQRILDFLCGEKIAGLQAENVALKGQLSNYAQTNAIVNALKPQPVPSYTVPNPNCCYGACTGIQ